MIRPLVIFRAFAAFVLLLAWVPVGALLSLVGFRDFALSVWGRIALLMFGVRVRALGPLPPRGSLVVANHASYLDIFILGSRCPGAFVAKSEIADWPLAGIICRLAGVVFIERDKARKVHSSMAGIARMLSTGERVIVFPEGGIKGREGELTPFHSMFFDPSALGDHPLVPVGIRYLDPPDYRVWAWVEETSALAHLTRWVLPAGKIEAALVFGEPLARAEGESRKETARRANETVAKLMNSVETKR